MSRKTIQMTDALSDYLFENSIRETPLMARLREETAALAVAHMQIAPEQGQFMALLVRTIGARRAIEVGVFTGYSSLWLASALPEDGQLVACDVNENWTAIARRYWQEAGLADRVELRLAPAEHTLDQLLATGEAGGFDFVFIDADKETTPRYVGQALELLRTGGMVAVDNVLMDGRVADAEDRSPGVEAMRETLRIARDSEAVDLSLVPIADGILLLRKR